MDTSVLYKLGTVRAANDLTACMRKELQKKATVSSLRKMLRRAKQMHLTGSHAVHTLGEDPVTLSKVLSSGKLKPGPAQYYGGTPGVYFGKHGPATTHPLTQRVSGVAMPQSKVRKHLIEEIKSENPRDKFYLKTTEIPLGRKDYLVTPELPRSLGLKQTEVSRALKDKRMREIHSSIYGAAEKGRPNWTDKELLNIVDYGHPEGSWLQRQKAFKLNRPVTMQKVSTDIPKPRALIPRTPTDTDRDTSVFYKLGTVRAANDLTAWMQSDEGNPTAPVITRKTAAEKAVERALQKLSKCKKKTHSAAGSITQRGVRAPSAKKSSFSRLKAKLKKRKG